MPAMIEAVKRAYVEYSAGRAVFPLRPRIPGRAEGVTLFMPGYLPAAEAMAVKIVSIFPRNPERGLPTLCAAIVLTDDSTGQALAFMEGGVLTAIRTGASSGLATDLLARPEAEVAALIGAGVQARTQLQAVAAVRRLRETRIYDLERAQAEEMARWAGQQGLCQGAILVSATADEAVEGADIVCAATTARRPVFSGEALKPGAHINGVGSFAPDMQEIGEDTMRRAELIVVDSREATLAEAGDLVIPLGNGALAPEKVRTELGEIAGGLKPGRRRPEDITVFKAVGIAALDVAAAKLVYDEAVRRGLGFEIDLNA